MPLELFSSIILCVTGAGDASVIQPYYLIFG
jgi:hypothetical protein